MSALYVVRKGKGYWEWLDGAAKDWWTKSLGEAAILTSLYMARRIAKRTGGEVFVLRLAPLESNSTEAKEKSE